MRLRFCGWWHRLPSKILGSAREELIRSSWPILIGHLTGKLLEILRKPSHQKLECGKAHSCKIWGMSKLSIHAACHMLHSMSQGVILIVFTVYVDTVNTGLNYIQITVYFELKPCINSNYNLFQIKGLH